MKSFEYYMEQSKTFVSNEATIVDVVDSIEKLDLTECNKLVSLGNIDSVGELYIYNCKKFETLGELKTVVHLDMESLQSFKSLGKLSTIYMLLSIHNCPSLVEFSNIKNARFITIKACDSLSIVKNIKQCDKLQLINCKKIKSLKGLDNCQIDTLVLHGTPVEELPKNMKCYTIYGASVELQNKYKGKFKFL